MLIFFEFVTALRHPHENKSNFRCSRSRSAGHTALTFEMEISRLSRKKKVNENMKTRTPLEEDIEMIKEGLELVSAENRFLKNRLEIVILCDNPCSTYSS